METQEKTTLLAHFEVGWWIAHHRKDKQMLVENMTQLYCLQFSINPELARKAVMLRVDATVWHDKAEECEDNGNQQQADSYWNKAEDCLRQHFEILEG